MADQQHESNLDLKKSAGTHVSMITTVATATAGTTTSTTTTSISKRLHISNLILTLVIIISNTITKSWDSLPWLWCSC